MLQDMFYWVFNMSIVAAVTGMIVLPVQSIRRIPKRLTIWLWIIPFLRLVLPIGLNSPYSFLSLLSRITTKTITVYTPARDIAFSMTNFVTAADGYFPITYKTDILDTVFHIATILWITVCLSLLFALTWIYVKALYDIKHAVPLRDNIYLSQTCLSPAVYGIVKPKIVLPASYKDRDIELILLHENTHIRRLDNMWRLLAFTVTAIHWFNPLCWYFLKRFLTDLELSCDECVVKHLGNVRAKDYARTLLDCNGKRPLAASAFGGAKLPTRIERILSFKTLSRCSLVTCIAFFAVVFYVLMTNAA